MGDPQAPSPIEQTRGRIDGRVLGGLLLLNVLVHFIPLARPGFHADDFGLWRLTRIDPPWGFVEHSLVQPTRPLGWLLYILSVKVFGLNEPSQLLILVSSSTLLTALVYAWLSGSVLPRATANLAALAFVVWPVKHEIYSSQLFGVVNLAGALIAASGLLYRRWVWRSSTPTLLMAVACYGLSILIYEIGYLAPLIFVLVDRPPRDQRLRVAGFAVPALFYWVLRARHELGTMGNGIYQPTADAFITNLLTSLPSNLIGYQVLRNIGYGLWGVINGPAWFQLWCAISGLAGGYVVARWSVEAGSVGRTNAPWKTRLAIGLAGAALMAIPAATVLVESRHSILAAVGMGVVVATVGSRLKPILGAALIVVLQLSTQGLALRQAELSRLQAAVFEVVQQNREMIRAADAVVFDMGSLAQRMDYTWGERSTNVLRAYWGLPAFSAPGLRAMVMASLNRVEEPLPSILTCADGLVVSEGAVICGRAYSDEESFQTARAGTLIIDFKAMPLPH